MIKEWTETKIEDIVTSISMGPFGSDIKSSNFVSDGVPIIRGGNLVNGKFHDEDFVYLTEEKADSLKNSNAFPEDIVFTHRGTLGQVGLIPHNSKYPRYVVSQSQMRITCDKTKVDTKFVYYFFLSPIGQNELLSNTSTTGVPAISRPLSSLKKVNISLPPLPVQKKIAAILSSLDDKIELNTRMNNVLEEIARALFHRWFVEFEFPNAEGKPYKSAGGKMVESEMGSVPEGWRVGTIGEIAKITSGKRPPRKESELSPECKIPILGASSVMGYTSDILYNEPILVTGRVGTHGIIQKSNTPCWPSDNTLVITSRWYEFAYQELLLVDYKNMNRGSTQPLITQGDLKKILIILPSETNINLFESMVSGIAGQINLNMDQSGVLSNLRDNLLPKLMSGEIEV